MKKDRLIGKTYPQLQEIVQELDLPKYAAKQIATWLYQKKINSIDDMSDLSKQSRQKLNDHFDLGLHEPAQAMRSKDGTVKYLFNVTDSYPIESVYIPDKNRSTLCVSSQVGCKMNCHFCMTGKQGFSKHLTTNDIINQIISIPESDELTNVVFMGMGEPLDNINELFSALTILTAPWGFAWSPKRITVSTIGLTKNLKRFLDESDCHLAVSLHSPFPQERLSIMPVEKAYPIEGVLELLRQVDFSKQRRLSFEYIMFHQFNDDLKHAAALCDLLKGMDCRINLIRFHEIPDATLKTSDEASMRKFQEYLESKGFICTIRSSRGEDIFAACGMLSSANK